MTVLFALCSLANGMLMSMGYAFHGCHQVFASSLSLPSLDVFDTKACEL